MNTERSDKYERQKRYAKTAKGRLAIKRARLKYYHKNPLESCGCGSCYNIYNHARHLRTQRHRRWLDAANNNNDSIKNLIAAQPKSAKKNT